MAFFTFEGKQVYYVTYGQGKPLLLLNGIMMSTASWRPFIEAFSSINQLIMVDFLDQGQSEKLVGASYTQDLQVELVAALLRHLSLEKVHLLGISYGGEVAQQFAVKYPAMVERLMLFNTCAYTSPLLADIGKAWNLAAESKNGASYYYTTIPVIYSPTYYTKRLDWMRNREKVLLPLFGNPAFTEAMVRLTKSADSHDVRDKLHLIQAPTLIVSSDQDSITPILEQKIMVEGIQDSHHVLLTDAGHASMYEQPLLFASLVLGFIHVPSTEFDI